MSKRSLRNSFDLSYVFKNTTHMSIRKPLWREDLMNSRDLSARDIEAYGFFVSWYDEWRMSRGLALGESSARHFWRECVLLKSVSYTHLTLPTTSRV